MQASGPSSPSLNPYNSSPSEIYKPDLEGKFDLQKLADCLLNGDYGSDPEYAQECWSIYIEEMQVDKTDQAKTPICVLNKRMHNSLLLQSVEKINITDWKPLLLALQESHEIISGFDFVKTSFTEESWASFCETFSKYVAAPSRKAPEGSLYITFNGCALEPHMSEAFNKLIGKVADLSFKNQNITYTQADALKALLPKAKQLSHLSLNAVAFDESAFSELLNGIQAGCPLNSLKLSKMPLDKGQMRELSACLKKNLNITSLYLTHDSLTSDTAEELAKELVEQKKIVEQKKGKEEDDAVSKVGSGVLKLCLEGNTELGIEGATAILQSLTNLEFLSLKGCTESIKILLPVVGTPIKEVNLGCLSVKKDDMRYLTALFTGRLEEASPHLPAHMDAEFLENVKAKKEKTFCIVEINEEEGVSAQVSILEWSIDVNLHIADREVLDNSDEDAPETIAMGDLSGSDELQAAYLAAFIQQHTQKNFEELVYESKIRALSSLDTGIAYITAAIDDPNLLDTILIHAEKSIKSRLLASFREQHCGIQTAWDLNEVFNLEASNLQNQALISYINANHFYIEDVPDDGNCLFWVALQGLHKIGLSLQAGSAQQLREKIVAHMEQSSFFKCLLGEELENYCADMKEEKTWAGDYELKALVETVSKELQVNFSINLYSYDEIRQTRAIAPSKYEIDSKEWGKEIEINILHTTNPAHYMLLMPRQGNEGFCPVGQADFSWLQPPKPEAPASTSSNVSMDPSYELSIATAIRLIHGSESPPRQDLKRKEIENPASSHKPSTARRLNFDDPYFDDPAPSAPFSPSTFEDDA